MFHMAFVHAVLIDGTRGEPDGSSWSREARFADQLVDTASTFDGRYEPSARELEQSATPPRRPGGPLRAVCRRIIESIAIRQPT